MDDLFEDDMSFEAGESMPNDSLLPHSQNRTSIMSDSTQTSTATLFRPAQPRNTPASGASRPAAGRNGVSSVKKFTDLLKLTKENHDILQKMYEITSPGEEYLGTLAYLVFACQQGISGGPGEKWVPGRVIRNAFKDAVADFIFRPDLQAFSKTVAANHTTMVDSLEILTFNYLKSLKADYVDKHLPGDYVAGEACIPGTATYLFIKETLKNQRSKVRSALLTNILGAPEGSALMVPARKTMVLTVARVCLAEARSLGDDELLLKLGKDKVGWIIFMRYVTVYNYLNHTENKKHCQWTLMDEALADLRGQPARNRALYFNRLRRYDRETFDGTRSWAAIKASGLPLQSPVVEKVLAQGPDNHPQGERSGIVSEGASAGDQTMEEDFLEDQ